MCDFSKKLIDWKSNYLFKMEFNVSKNETIHFICKYNVTKFCFWGWRKKSFLSYWNLLLKNLNKLVNIDSFYDIWVYLFLFLFYCRKCFTETCEKLLFEVNNWFYQIEEFFLRENQLKIQDLKNMKPCQHWKMIHKSKNFRYNKENQIKIRYNKIFLSIMWRRD
jgi:hypothetical protein